MPARLFTDAQEAEIAAQYRSGEDRYAIARRWGCSPGAVVNALKRQGVESRGSFRFTDAEETQIARDYANGASTTVLAKTWGCSTMGIRCVLRRRGVPVRAKTQAALTPEEQRAAIATYLSGETAASIAARHGRCDAVVLKLLRRNGICTRSKAHHLRQFTPDQDAKIAAAYATGISLRDLAHQYRCNKVAIANAIRRAGGSLRQRARVPIPGLDVVALTADEHRRAKARWRRASNIQVRIRAVLRSRVRSHIRARFEAAALKRVGHPVLDLGCTIDELIAHIEAQFTPGMSWENHGFRGWHVDHVRPLSAFDLTDRQQFLEACHYKNLQPLWWRDNIRKGGVTKRRPR